MWRLPPSTYLGSHTRHAVELRGTRSTTSSMVEPFDAVDISSSSSSRGRPGVPGSRAMVDLHVSRPADRSRGTPDASVVRCVPSAGKPLTVLRRSVVGHGESAAHPMTRCRQTGHVSRAIRSWVLHVDLDQFVAAVEVLRRPELAGKPVIVGGRGDPTERAVVSTASYEARQFGVGSGMPLRLAARKVPDAVILPVDAPAYTEASEQVMDALRGLGVVVEVL